LLGWLVVYFYSSCDLPEEVAVAGRAVAVVDEFAMQAKALRANACRAVTSLASAVAAAYAVVRRRLSQDEPVAIAGEALAPVASVTVRTVAHVARGCRRRIAALALLVRALDTVVRGRLSTDESIVVAVLRARAQAVRVTHRAVRTEAPCAGALISRAVVALKVVTAHTVVRLWQSNVEHGHEAVSAQACATEAVVTEALRALRRLRSRASLAADCLAQSAVVR
jgi:hypothetical protein